MQPTAQPPCCLVPSQPPLACVRSRLIALRFTLRAAFGSLSLYVRLCRPTGCLRQAVLGRILPGCLTLRAAYTACRATALLLGSQPAPAGMCSGLPPSLPLMSPYGLPSSGYPASPRWHVFPSPVSGFRFLLPPPSAIPASPREPLAFVLHVYFTALSSVALTNSPQMAKCHHD
jgi:hypothetical protein